MGTLEIAILVVVLLLVFGGGWRLLLEPPRTVRILCPVAGFPATGKLLRVLGLLPAAGRGSPRPDLPFACATRQPLDGRGHFVTAAAEAMRRILVEQARSKATLKRGGKSHRLELDQIELACNDQADELFALDEALCELERHEAQATQLVSLYYESEGVS